MVHNAYIIAGPTASGKSDFAHQLARHVNGVIINCDSVQIYRGIENISASPLAGRDPNDTIIDGVPYKLFSILPLTEQISVVDYLTMARTEYDAAVAAGKTPIFVGGTGFYINAILNGISPIPDVSSDVRERARGMVANDPQSAVKMLGGGDFRFTDPQRTARALEVLLETGRPISYWQSLPCVGAIVPTPFKILINPDADVLRNRIAARIPLMMAGGALTEAKNIIATAGAERRAIGAESLCKFIRGEFSATECNENWINKTNQYAKRQRTWFRTQFNPDVIINN